MQVSADPLLQGVFEDLCSEAGAELYVRSLAAYGVAAGEMLTWAQVRQGWPGCGCFSEMIR